MTVTREFHGGPRDGDHYTLKEDNFPREIVFPAAPQLSYTTASCIERERFKLHAYRLVGDRYVYKGVQWT